MFHRGTRLPAFADCVSALHPIAHHPTARGVQLLTVGIAMLINPGNVLAQRGGGGGGGGGHDAKSNICLHDCPAVREGLSSEDELKNFRRTIALQATAEQRAAFTKVSQYTQAASEQLHAFQNYLKQFPAASPLTDHATALDEAIDRARSSNQNFLASLSSKQKTELKETAKKLEKADSDLDKQVKTLRQTVQAPKPDTGVIASRAADLDKAISVFMNEQLALGVEMSILSPAPGEGVAFTLPTVTNSVDIAGQPVSITVSGDVSRISTEKTSTENGSNLFSVKLVADLSDVQQDITGILRSRLTRLDRCGEHIEILQGTLTPLVPACLVVANLHYERWVCAPSQASPTEVADSNGTLEVKLTPSIEPSAGLSLASEINRVEATGFLRDLLRSGDLGFTLKEQIAASLLSALQKAAELNSSLPPVAHNSSTLQKAQFQDAGADQLSMVLEGQLQFSDAQAQQFASQLKQRVSAQGRSAQ
jgi:hypothetical protein